MNVLRAIVWYTVQIVKSVRARSTDVEPEINLRKRTDRKGHGRGIAHSIAQIMLNCSAENRRSRPKVND